MKQNEKLEIKRQVNGSEVSFTLVATELDRQSKNEPTKYFPWFSETEATFSKLSEYFGREKMEEFAVKGLRQLVQQLYFTRTADEVEQVVMIEVEVEENGQKVKKLQPKLTEKGIEIKEKVLVPNIPDFKEALENEKLSAREVTAESLMRKATLIMAGTGEKYKSWDKSRRMIEAQKLMTQAQEMMVAEMAKNTPESK